MKVKLLKLEKPCEEKWENMVPVERGRFCSICAKNVVDFSTMSPDEIAQSLKKLGSSFCARATPNQLNMPVWEPEYRKKSSLPYSKIAAGLMLAGSLSLCQTAQAENVQLRTEFVQSSSSITQNAVKKKITDDKDLAKGATFVFKGKIVSKIATDESFTPVINAKITLVTLSKVFSTYTLADGTFAMDIPLDMIDDDNVVAVEYFEATTSEGLEHREAGFENQDYILSKEEMQTDFNINQIRVPSFPMLMFGGISYRAYEWNPMVKINGTDVKYKELVMMQRGESNLYDVNKMQHLFFSGKYAEAILGKPVKDGLFLYFDKE